MKLNFKFRNFTQENTYNLPQFRFTIEFYFVDLNNDNDSMRMRIISILRCHTAPWVTSRFLVVVFFWFNFDLKTEICEGQFHVMTIENKVHNLKERI